MGAGNQQTDDFPHPELTEVRSTRSRWPRPTTVQAYTQGQSLPVFTLAHLLGFDLMPRIRNWKGLPFDRPNTATARDPSARG
ncbi:Tn3 family transposase [Streptomyces canus]